MHEHVITYMNSTTQKQLYDMRYGLTKVLMFQMLLYISRLLAEIENVLGDRTEVTGDDLDKMKYTEQVLRYVTT